MVGVVRMSLVACLVLAAACAAPASPPATTSSPTPVAEPEPEREFAEATRSVPVFADPTDATTFAEIPEGRVVLVIREERGWLRVEFLLVRPTGSEEVFGWIPAAVDGRAMVRRWTADCPGRASVADIAAMSGAERLICYGADEVELEGWATGEPIADFVFEGEPAWLATPSAHRLSSIDPIIGGPAFPVHLVPALEGEWPIGSQVTVRGHFDDPRSADCRRSGPAAASTETPEESVLWCRQRFVVTELDTIPTVAALATAPGAPEACAGVPRPQVCSGLGRSYVSYRKGG